MTVLDLAAGQGQQAFTFAWRLLTRDGALVAELHPVRGGEVSHDTSLTISRTLTGLVLSEAEAVLVDPLAHRVEVSMLTHDGASWPLGLFLFADATRVRSSSGLTLVAGMFDQGFVLDQEQEETFSVAAGSRIEDAIRAVAASAGFPDAQIETSSGTAGSALTWPAGTSRAKVLADLAILGGYLSPYFDSAGELRVRQSFDPATLSPMFDFDAGSVIRGSITETDDLLDAPNRFVVIDNSTTEAPIVGRFDLPVAAPHSFENRGFRVVDVVSVQGLGSQSQADVAAQAEALRRPLFQRAELSTTPDPRHDAYDVVRWQGEQWLELAWSLPLQPGGEMRHTLRKVYG